MIEHLHVAVIIQILQTYYIISAGLAFCFVHLRLNRKSFQEKQPPPPPNMCCWISLVVETLRDSLPWNVWAGFPLFLSGAKGSLRCLHTTRIHNPETWRRTCPSGTTWPPEPVHESPPSFSRNYDLLLYHSITWLYFCPFWLSLPLSFPPWNAVWAWPCESRLPHWPHQSRLSSSDAALTQISHTLLRHSPLVWPVTTGRLFLLSCHVSRDVRALLCVWLADVFCDVPSMWEMWCGRPSLTMPQKRLWSTFCAASCCKM